MQLYKAYPYKEKFFDYHQSKQMGDINKLAGTTAFKEQIACPALITGTSLSSSSSDFDSVPSAKTFTTKARRDRADELARDPCTINGW